VRVSGWRLISRKPGAKVVMVTREGNTENGTSNDTKGLKHTDGKHEHPLTCSICAKPATQLVDGDPSCDEHIEQVYEHQVEDYTVRHLVDNEWRKV